MDNMPCRPEQEACVLWSAERVGRFMRQQRIYWEQEQWAKNNATFSWRASAPLRAAEALGNRIFKKSYAESKKALHPLLQLAPSKDICLPATDVRISVIIPTLNAGADFETLLQTLRTQIGIRKLEIVIVDSGSNDNTLYIAGKYAATIINIPTNEFTHAHARNIGAEAATGSYLLFMTQDALPDGKTWLRRLIEPLLRQTVMAVTCKEKPRKNADLFSLIGTNEYEKDLERASMGDYIGVLPDEESYNSLLRNAGLSNVACAMSKQTFHKYLFQASFAEDLELGIRLLRDGGKIGFLSSAPVIHSHNRPPYYYLKRSFVNVTHISKIIPSMPLPDMTLQKFTFCALGTIKRLVAYNHFMKQELASMVDIDEFTLRSNDFISGMDILGYAYIFQEKPANTGDDDIDDVMLSLQILSLQYSYIDETVSHVLFENLNNRVFNYLKFQSSNIFDSYGTHVADVLLKYFAIWLGECIAAMFLDPRYTHVFSKLAETLSQGV